MAKKIKHNYLRVKDDGSILMTVNHRLNYNQIENILAVNFPKLKIRINQLKSTQSKTNQISQIYFLGQLISIKVIVIPATINYITPAHLSELNDDEQHARILNVYVKNAGDMSIIKQQITLWYESMAQHIFYERFSFCLSKISAWNVSAPKLQIRKMKSRWGSYSRATHKVCLSLWLIKLSVELIDYVINHELTHIIHFNHSKDFYTQLASICPAWDASRKYMRTQRLTDY